MDGADCSTFARRQSGGGMSGAGRGASANPSNAGFFRGVECAGRVRAGDYPPEHSRRVQGRFSRGSRGAGSPPSASAWPAPRSPESARGANSPNALARGGGKQSRPAQQGKRFSVRPSAFGGFGRMRRGMRGRAACARGRRRGAFANPAGVAPDIPGALAASAVGGAIPPAFAASFSPAIPSPVNRSFLITAP